MGCLVELLDDGREVDVHRFDHREDARRYLLSRSYRFERTKEWAGGTILGLDFYQGPELDQAASLRKKGGYWQVTFWSRFDEV